MNIELKNKLGWFDIVPETPMYVVEQGNAILILSCQVIIDMGNISKLNMAGYRYQKCKTGRYEKKLVMYIQAYYEKDGVPNSLFIRDINVERQQRSKGYGSILMAQFIECAKHLEISSITGDFSPIDNTDENRDRRRRIYEKYGFIVTDTKVYLDLKK